MLGNLLVRLQPARAPVKRVYQTVTGRCALRLVDYCPRPELVTRVTVVERPRFPVYDVHNHLVKEFEGRVLNRPLAAYLDEMDQAGVEKVVDLDGGWGEQILDQHLAFFKEQAPERFQIYGGVDWSRWPEEGNQFGRQAAQRLEGQLRRGAQGLKIWKPLGLEVTDEKGQRVPVDDARLDPLWDKAAEWKVPVMVHIADPVAFFQPNGRFNERYEELCSGPWQPLSGPQYPSFETLIEQFGNLVRRHKATTFIGAHVGCYAENLDWVSNLLHECPNFFVDISARVAELGRQPYSARRFFLEHQDRILFGTDMMTNPRWYRIYYRFLETDDEYFEYGLSVPPSQGRWRVYGLYLPDEVLEKVYNLNARRILAVN